MGLDMGAMLPSSRIGTGMRLISYGVGFAAMALCGGETHKA